MTVRVLSRVLATVGLIALIAIPPRSLAAAGFPLLDPERGVMTMAPLLERTTPAVVSISVEMRNPGQENPLLNDPFFRRFFGAPPQRGEERGAMSAGSGVIVDAREGLVMTNHHVIDKAARVTVVLQDGRRLPAALVGSDPETDIAVLRVPAENLAALPFADSDTLKVGDIAIAIGNPFGLGQTVTSGIVSALGRGIGMHGFEDFIQTDAPINPGNSGGALVNTRGELIGINSAIIGPAGGNVGIGFAVPSNMARAVMDQLVAFGEVRRGRLGVRIQDLTPDIADALGLEITRGALIAAVEPGSPADEAALKAGDVVIAVGDEAVRSAADLRNKVGLARRGTRLSLRYLREGAEGETRVTVAEPPEAAIDRMAVPQLAGATLAPLGRDHPAHGSVKGVLVADAERGSPAWRSGLRPGDIVLSVNRRPVTNLKELVAVVGAAEGTLALEILRGRTVLLLLLRG